LVSWLKNYYRNETVVHLRFLTF